LLLKATLTSAASLIPLHHTFEPAAYPMAQNGGAQRYDEVPFDPSDLVPAECVI